MFHIGTMIAKVKVMIKVNLRLKEMRIEARMTQKQVGEHLGISSVVYNRYETGARSVPIEILWALADFYKESIDYLVGREN